LHQERPILFEEEKKQGLGKSCTSSYFFLVRGIAQALASLATSKDHQNRPKGSSAYVPFVFCSVLFCSVVNTNTWMGVGVQTTGHINSYDRRGNLFFS